MSQKQIVPFGDPILRKVAKPVEEVTPKIIKLLDDMAATLYADEGRAGLAAPQVGILKRVIVMDCGDGLIELINPEIMEMSGEQVGPEACLSFPGYAGNVKRATYVKVKSINRQGNPFILEGEDFLARCIQHEVDHLDGILFVDHVQDKWLFHEKTKKKLDVLEVIKLTNQGRTSGI
ncbi:MAG TPA: peptide deformylase [Candidatus Bathyarchaeia archaeon]|nr:peptide deformylase [Candidatus Bathyarchaeia archaeon]